MGQTRNYAFGDKLSEAIRAIKKCEGRKISIIQDELGYTLGLNGGSAVERWRQGFLPPKLETRDLLARELIRRSCGTFDRAWLAQFLAEAEHPYAEQLCEELFPTKTAVSSPSTTVLPSIPPPPPTPIPVTQNFIGRQAELGHFQEQLANGRLALIVGMAGMGKTTIAAQLSQEAAVNVFWHSFHDGEGSETLIWKLAAFLAHHNQPDLWQLLQNSQQTGGTPPPTATLFDYLHQSLQQQKWLLCFDDLQLVDDDPQLTQFLARLQAISTLQLIVTSRKRPLFLNASNFQPLTGFDSSETAELLQRRDLLLEESLREDLQQLTAGNVQFLTLAIDALKHTHQPDALLQRLAETDHVEQYLLEQIDERLSRDERGVMTACAILLGQEGTADALSAIANRDTVQRTVRSLVSRHLLTTRTTEAGRTYEQHAILQSFYYEINGRRQQRRLHQRAASYYETEEIDTLKAARHYQAAAQYREAARLATEDIRGFINQGRAGELQNLLTQAEGWQLDNLLWVKVLTAQGQLEALFGKGQQARLSYERALRALEPLAKTAVFPNLQAQIHLGMGELLEPTDPAAAADWVQRGLATQPTEPTVLAALHLTSGTAQLNLGAFDAAKAELERGLSLLPPEAMQLRSQAWREMGAVHFHHGQYEQAKEATYRAIEMSERLRDWLQMSYLLSNLAVFKFLTADWRGAIQDWEQALQLAEHVGSQEQITAVATNLGSAYFYQGQHAQAEAQLLNALHLAEQHQFDVQVVHCQQRLAQLATRRRDWASAGEQIEQAWQSAQRLQIQALLPELENCRAEIMLATGNLTQADTHATTALEQAQTLGMTEQVGISYRLLGEIAAARQHLQEAYDAFGSSLAILDSSSPYETARTQAAWGLALQQNGRSAHDLLENAATLFTHLNAQYDLQQMKAFA
ncbi:MAG: AAA family ATPase [Chloroflexota bacterium]